MPRPDRFIEGSDEWLEQQDHERMRKWQQEHGWGTAYSRSPEEIYMLIQEHGENTDINDIESED